MRAADDPEHTRLIDCLRDTSTSTPINADFIQTYLSSKIIDPQELNSPEWQDATILVSGNLERIRLNERLAHRHAQVKKTHLIIWQSELAATRGISHENRQRLESHDKEALQLSEPGLFEYFVQGAPAVISQNVNVGLGIANGTRVKMHSLAFDDPVKAHRAQVLMENSYPGAKVFLDYPPDAINVEVPHISIEDWPPGLSLTRDSVVIPIRRDRPVDVSVWLASARKEYRVSPIAVDMCYAMTINKAQGQTTGKIVVNLNKSKANTINRLTLPSLYVAMSRVKSGADVRLLSRQASDSWDYLTHMSHKNDLIQFMNAYDPDTGYLVKSSGPAARATTVPLPATPRRAGPRAPARPRPTPDQVSVAGNMSSQQITSVYLQPLASATDATEDRRPPAGRRRRVRTAAERSPPSPSERSQAQPNGVMESIDAELRTSGAQMAPRGSVGMGSQVVQAVSMPIDQATRASPFFVPLLHEIIRYQIRYSGRTSQTIEACRSIVGSSTWNTLARAYQEDFQTRGIQIRDIHIDANGYIDWQTQERLLFRDYGGGQSMVSPEIITMLLDSASRYMQAVDQRGRRR
jgi:hypothetical protein